MAPDIEELIKKVNTLTLDKNRLRQKLTQLQSNPNTRDTNSILNQLSSQQQASINSLKLIDLGERSQGQAGGNYNDNNNGGVSNKSNANSNVIAGVECATSCEEDILYMNDLYRKRLDEYNENWDYIQSKCTALLSELIALQKHFAILKREKLELEEKFRIKCDDYDKTKSELQTVVLNYETQLSAMSEHLSMITSKVSLDDDNLARSHSQPH